MTLKKWLQLLGFFLFANSCYACICKDNTLFSLELVDQTPLIVDIRYEAKTNQARVIRIYKGMMPDSIPINISNCKLEDGALYHVYFKETNPSQLAMSAAVRCKRLYQSLVEYVNFTEIVGTQPEQYNVFITTIKKTHQELVILRSLKERYSGRIKHSLLLTSDLKDVNKFTILKGKMRLGQRVGKWIYYEWEGDRWVRHTKRYKIND